MLKHRAHLGRLLGLLLLAAAVPSGAFAQAPYGLDSRAPIGPYLNNTMPPFDGAFPFPTVLSATGAFSNVPDVVPTDGLIPYTVNSPLWSDGALKERWMAVPNDGPPYDPGEQIDFVPTGEWTFPNGTVFVKEFDLIVNEVTQEKKRLETRLLVRDENGAVYGVTYKWRADNSEADLLTADGLDEDNTITTATGETHIQTWHYPSREECLFCHNPPANYVLGPKTHQLNGTFTYPSTGRTDNQLRSLNHLGMFNPSVDEAEIPNLLHSVLVTDETQPIELRARSWIDSNCSQCHRPTGYCPSYDARFYTPLADQNLVDSFVKFRDIPGSELYQRDDALDDTKMPPLDKNLVHEAAMTVLRQWIASPLEVLSVYFYQDNSHLMVRFNSHVDPVTATVASNYTLDQNQVVTEAVMSSEPDTVILTCSPLAEGFSYSLSTRNIQDTAPSANTVWLDRAVTFVAQSEPAAVPHWLANLSTRVDIGSGDQAPIAGFITRGGDTKRMLIRGLGPSLASGGIANTLADPVLNLYDDQGQLLASDDNWQDNANQQEIIDSGLAPASDNEAVILLRVPSDDVGIPYTAVLSGADGATGVGLVEVYDLDFGVGPTVQNISTRGNVNVGEGVLIGGTIVLGSNSQDVIVRALGPSLPVDGTLADPTLELYDENGALLRSNDNWRSDQEAEIEATNLQPTNDSEAAILATLQPAPYTAVVRGANDAVGVALVEIYGLN
ncbi:MAG TPA: hypothetical protein VGL24_11720 [Chthoniobacterales bacterium]|jgi:hypothetical protein